MKIVWIALAVPLALSAGIEAGVLDESDIEAHRLTSSVDKEDVVDAIKLHAAQGDPLRDSDLRLAPSGTETQLVPNGDFEQGRTVWDIYSSNRFPVIYRSSDLIVPPHSGFWAAWMGGYWNEETIIEQRLRVPADNPFFKFWYWIGSADFCGNDVAGVVVNANVVVDAFWLCDDNDTYRWVLRSVDMSAYAGRLVYIAIVVSNDANYNSNLFIDDVFFQYDVQPPPPEGDLRGLEVFFRDAPGDQGSIITSPYAGQNVYPHFRFSISGTGPLTGTLARIEIDGATRCSMNGTANPGTWVTWCGSPWTATAGNHTLTGRADPSNQFNETNEGNNVVTQDLDVGKPPFFGDGFESGDCTLWTAQEPPP